MRKAYHSKGSVIQSFSRIPKRYKERLRNAGIAGKDKVRNKSITLKNAE